MSSDIKSLIWLAEKLIDATNGAISKVKYEQACILYEHVPGDECEEAYQRNEDMLDNLSASLESIKDAKGYLEDANSI